MDFKKIFGILNLISLLVEGVQTIFGKKKDPTDETKSSL